MTGFLRGIRARLVLLALAAAVPALLAVLYSAIVQYRDATEEAEAQVLRFAEVIASRERSMIDDARSALGLLSRNSRIGPRDPDRCAGLLREMYNSGIINAQTMAVVSVVMPDGGIHCSSRPTDQPVNVSDRRYFQQVMETRQFTLGGVIVGRQSRLPMVPAAYPILDGVGEVAAVLVAGLNLPELAGAVPELPEGADVTLLRADGLVLGRRPDADAWVGESFPDAPLVRALASVSGAAVIEEIGLDGVRRIYAVQRLGVGDTVLYAAVGFSTDAIYAGSRVALANGLFAALAAAVAAILLGRILGHGLVFRSVQALSRAAERLAQGDFTARVPVGPARDELGAVAKSFNSMAAALADREAALRESEQRYRDVVELIQAGVWIHVDGRIVFANDYAARMFGAYSPAELIGREMMSLIHPEDQARAAERTSIMTEGRGQQIPLAELRFQRLDGRPILVEAQAARFVRDGKVHILATGRDVTAQREAEEQLRQSQKMESVGRLTGGVAHDFNNLLTIIIGNLDTVLHQAPVPLRRAIDSALQAAERAATLTQRLLAYSRRQPLDPEVVDLNALVASLDDMLRRTLGEDIEIATTLDPDLWPVLADRGQVENSLLNLVVNARDAMPEGGKLTIETSRVHLDEGYAERNIEVMPGDYAMLAVTDSGTGMPPDVAERAIEPFFTTKTAGKGTGLGLSMIYGFAKQSRGHLKIYSEIDHGTTVRLYLPRAATATDVSTNAGMPAEEQPSGGETILVVEDDAAVRTLVVAQLEDLGYRVIEAADGPAAQAILRSGVAIDLLFTDVVMPGGMTGRKLAEEASRQRPGLRTLFTSGYTENSIVHQGRLDPGVQLLSKPYKKRDLARKIRDVLDAPVKTPSA
jgi:PAS domain S-box-containing protein